MPRVDSSCLATVTLALLYGVAARAQTGPAAPSNSQEYLQYGVALTAETQASGGDVCPAGAEAPCILGPGGGLTLRVAYRARGPWLMGGAYEVSRHDSSNLLRLPILQQLRAEGRYYLDRQSRLTPYGSGGVGLAVYGSEWGASTYGLVATIGPGVEFQITQSTVVGFCPMYRALVLRGFTDSADQRRADGRFGFGLAHFVGLELVLEVRDPLPRW